MRPISFDQIANLVGKGPRKLALYSDIGGAAGWIDNSSAVYLDDASLPVAIGGAAAPVAGYRLTIANVGTLLGALVVGLAATDNAIAGRVTGDTQNRIAITADGVVTWSSGSAAADVRLYRPSASNMRFDDNATTNNLLKMSFALGDPGGFLAAVTERTTNNDVAPILVATRLTTGTASAGIGTGLDFAIENASGTGTPAGRISVVMTSVTAGSEQTDIRFANTTSGSVYTEKWRMRGSDGALVMMTNSSIVPNNDSQGNIGGPAVRFSQITGNTFAVYGAAGHANPTLQLTSGAIQFGSGAGSALDVRIQRSAANTLQFDNGSTGGIDLLPTTDNTGNIGSPSQRWSLVRAVTITSGFHGETEVFPTEFLPLDQKVTALNADMVQQEFPEAPGEMTRHLPRVTFTAARAVLDLVAEVRALRERIERLGG